MTNNFDILIIGGGFAGLTAGLAIAQDNPHLKIALLEKSDIINQDKSRDGRAFAISKSSLELFIKIGIWGKISEFAGAINEIKIVDGDSPFYLNFDSATATSPQLGVVIENFYIHNALRNQALKQNNLKIICPHFYQEIIFEKNQVLVNLDNDEVVTARLLLACDGRFSALRAKFNITTLQKSYGQTALVFNIQHQKPHNNIALEKFLPQGPFAVLPFKDPHQSSIVWTVKTGDAATIFDLDSENFLQQLQKSMGNYLGEVKVTTKPFKYNLDLLSAKQYYYQRMALIGDAAHGMHPIAGQGFNVGVEDIKFLNQLVKEYSECGLDIGSETLLQKYQKVRKLGAGKMIFATDSLNSLFSNKILPIKAARNFGLGMVEKIPTLKKYFIKNAGG